MNSIRRKLSHFANGFFKCEHVFVANITT
jgi:hypothetical protein